MAPVPWSEAMAAALTGGNGFYRGAGAPRSTFSTPSTVGSALARVVAVLARRVDAALGHPPTFDVVDVGAADGTLLRATLAAVAREDALSPDRALAPRLRSTAVDLGTGPPPRPLVGMLVAVELLDTVPVGVFVRERDGTDRAVLVERDGREHLGPPAAPQDLAWLDRWWPQRLPGNRSESGWRRDERWRDLVLTLDRGVALAVDYGHRTADRPGGGTLMGWSRGRAVAPVPDGTMDVTAHVALDACAVAGRPRGEPAPVLTTVADLTGRTLGPTARTFPAAWLEAARQDPLAALERLGQEGEVAALRDPAGIGSFTALLQARGTVLPVAGEPVTGEPVGAGPVGAEPVHDRPGPAVHG